MKLHITPTQNEYIQKVGPLPHVLVETDDTNGWEGKSIALCPNKDLNRIAAVYPVVSTEEVVIRRYPQEHQSECDIAIIIDGFRLPFWHQPTFIRNLGMDWKTFVRTYAHMDFENWSEGTIWTGKLLHFTDLRYEPRMPDGLTVGALAYAEHEAKVTAEGRVLSIDGDYVLIMDARHGGPVTVDRSDVTVFKDEPVVTFDMGQYDSVIKTWKDERIN
jgi:hypothetical protein